MAKLRSDKEKQEAAKPARAKTAPSPAREPRARETREPRLPESREPRLDAPETAQEEARTGYLLQCAPGLSKVLQKELNFVGATTRDQKLFVKLQRNHDLIFVNQVKSDLRLDEMRTAEMVLKCPAYGRYKISQRQLGLMAQVLTATGPRRLVVSVAGKVFQRQDLARFLNKQMAERGYSFNDDIEDEVWMFCIDESWYFGLPVFKNREQRSEEREGSLPPTIAAAMAFAAVPRNEDVVLDPTCGSGTLLAEFHKYAPEAHLHGRDIDAHAVKVARRNVPAADIQEGDSRETTELEPTLVLANLPFGKQFGEKETNADLYRAIVTAVMKPGARGIFLTSDTESFSKVTMNPEIMFKVKIRGELATCFKIKA